MAVSANVPSLKHIEGLLRALKKVQTNWNQHLIFVDAELPSSLSISVTDSKASLGDVLTGLAHEARLCDFRFRRLADIRIWNGADVKKRCTVEKLLSLIDEPVASETASSMLRRAAMQLEEQVRDDAPRLEDMENRTAKCIKDPIDVADDMSLEELDESTASLVRFLKVPRDWREGLAQEPDDAVWTAARRISLRLYETYGECLKTAEILRAHEKRWLGLLRWAAKYGVQVCARQTLITEYFGRVSDYEEGEEEGESEGESEDGVED